jgi:biopolymer transport protein ExbB
MGALDFLKQSDGVGQFIALLLLLMSLASWVVIFWKAWVIKRAVPDVARAAWRKAVQRLPHLTVNNWCFL